MYRDQNRRTQLRGERTSLPLERFGDAGAYVLLGAPGSGKTTEFLRQAEESGGRFVTARDFLTFDDDAAWHGNTLFIDALDEVRAGCADGRTAMDAIRAKLARLGSPRFRLSCREADWFGSNDRHHLEAVSPDGGVRVLHLDPLSEEGAEEILEESFRIDKPEAFIRLARERGVDGMLINPQSLGMLVRAVDDNDWPSTRTEMFELACGTLLKELNQEHWIAVPEVADTGGLMRAAGKLFAVQLLTGAAGYERLNGEGTQDFLALEEIPDANVDVLRRAIRTKLFEMPDGERALPFHRQIAEFVAARYLADRIAKGLSPGRILALMTGHDGSVVTDLRGLCAWLAAQSQSSRAELIARDPLGTVLYGDVQGFSGDEKRQILGHLEHSAKDNPWFVRTIQIDSRVGDLIFPGVEDAFRGRTLDMNRDDRRQAFVFLLVEMFAHGKPIDRVARGLLDIIQDETWWPRIRHRAIEAFVRQRGGRARALADLKALAQDVYAGGIPDRDDDLLGSLLERLYPDELSESEVLGFLRAPKRPDQILSYEYFWSRQLAKRSSCDQMARILDKLVEMRGWLHAEVWEHGRQANMLWRVPSNLLERYLSNCQEVPDPHRLFDWLGLAGWVGDWKYDARPGSHARDRICAWIGERPDLWKSIMALGLEHCIAAIERSESHNFAQLMWMEEERRLFGAPRPSDFANWCLDQAVATENSTAAAWLMYRVAEAVHRGDGKKKWRNLVNARIAGVAEMQGALEFRLAKLNEFEEAERKSRERPARRASERQLEWQTLVTKYQVELRENRASLRLLHQLAKAYLGGFGDVVGRTPRERLSNLLGGDDELVETAMAGVRGTVSREDLPTAEEVIRLGVQQRMHFLSYPFLAGLDEIFEKIPTRDVFLFGNQGRLALAMHYNVAVWPRSWDEADGKPRWLPTLLKDHPELVANVLVRTARLRLRKGLDFSQHLYDLAHSADHKNVACLSALPLLSAFPVRCAERQLSSLMHVLFAACFHCEREMLVELIERKLASRSMNVAQRVYWLAAGVIVRPEHYLAVLESYVAGNERRVWRLGQFFSSRFDTPRVLIERLDVAALSLLIRVIGATHRPYSLDSDSDEGARVTLGMEAADRVHGLINQLAGNSRGEASKHLERLSVNDTLIAWRPQLVDAKDRQNALRRDASFVYAGVGQVVNVLNNEEPANVADLAALTLEQLRQTASFIRVGNTDDWRKYWNVDSHNRAERPKPENACRDALLSDLRHRLGPLGIDAQRESSYADDKRADIRVSYGDFNVPIEIKKSCHRDLWSAIRRQLIAKYTRDPDADGHGIYVVFWFGDTEHCRPTPGTGGIPISAADVEQRLLHELSAEERKKIAICVIDVAKPHGSRLLIASKK